MIAHFIFFCVLFLQIMLIGDNKCLIEFVEKDIFDKIMSDSENDEKENL